MPIRLRYSPEYRRVRSLLDPLAMRALEQVEDDIAFDPSIGPYRQQTSDGAIFDYHGMQGDLIVRYRRLSAESVEFEALRDLRSPDL